MKNSFLLLLIIISHFSYSQYIASLGGNPNDPNKPLWAQKMYADNANMLEVEMLYKEYYKSHPFQKNKHTQYFKHWRNLVRSQVNADGSILAEKPLSVSSEENRGSNGWIFLGPNETITPINDDVSNRNVSWQNNIYCIALCKSNPSVLYCGGETGGVHKTTDKGINWSPVSAGIAIDVVTAVQVSPTNPDVAFCANSNNIWRTTDGGVSWNIVYTEAGFEALSIQFNELNTQTIIASGNRGLIKSVDGGASWTKKFPAVLCWDVKFHPTDTTTIYLLKNNPPLKRVEFLKSTNAWDTFSVMNNGWYITDAGSIAEGGRIAVTTGAPDMVYAIILGTAFTGADEDLVGFFRSFDKGDSWSTPNAPIGGPFDGVSTIHVANSDPDGSGFSQGFYDLALATSPTDPGFVVTGTTSIYATYDSGATFVGKGGYVDGVDWIHPDVQDAVFSPSGEFYLATDGGIDYSNDDFQTAQSRNKGIRGSDLWGFGQGWNEDVLVGGRYHNGNMAWHQNYPAGKYLRMGGAEEATGYVNPGMNRKVYFSDIGGKQIPEFITQPFNNIPFGINPNESYFQNESSEVEFDPRYYNIMYTGYQNSIWKSEDGGNSFSILYSFGTNTADEVHEIEVSRTNPDIIYCFLRKDNNSAGTIYKTTDGGQSWTALANPTPGNKRQMSLALDQSNPDILWISLRAEGVNSQNKVWKFDGTSWTNLTTTVLNGTRTVYLAHQAGTDGGLYLGTSDGVFYRNNGMTNWVVLNSGLPLLTNTLKVIPFYKTAKLRNATYGRGVWETDLYEPSSVIAQPSVDKKTSTCIRDTFYFSDYSILKHSGASWNWSFPGASWVSATNQWSAKVVYNTPGSYDVSLTVTDGGGQSSSKTITGMVTVFNNCKADSVPGLALECSADSGSHAQTQGDFNIRTNSFTISGWIKPTQPETGLSGVFFDGGEDVTGLHIENNNELNFHYKNELWWVNTGLFLDMNSWNYVAMSVTPTKLTIYMNEQTYERTGTYDSTFIHSWAIGRDPRYGNDRVFKGLVDEFCFWNRALTRDEIRELRHLVKKPEVDNTLIAYYQFNEVSGQANDKVSNFHALVSSGAIRKNSTAPVGPGVSYRMNVSVAGSQQFNNTGLSFVAPVSGTYADGEMVATHLQIAPDFIPDTGWVNQYWVLNNYGFNQTFSALDEINFDDYGLISTLEANDPSRFVLYGRTENGEGNSWGTPLDVADALISGVNGSIRFNNALSPVTTGKQLVVSNLKPEADTIVSVLERRELGFALFPNPSQHGISWIQSSELVNAKVFVRDIQGKIVLQTEMQVGIAKLNGSKLSEGIYSVQIVSDGKIAFLKWKVER